MIKGQEEKNHLTSISTCTSQLWCHQDASFTFFFFFLPAQEGSRRQWSSPGNVLERKAVPQPVLWPWLWTSAPRSCWLPSNLGHSLYLAFEVFNSFYWTFIPFHSFIYLFIYLHLQFWAWTGNQQLRLVSIFPFCLVLHIFEIE